MKPNQPRKMRNKHWDMDRGEGSCPGRSNPSPESQRLDDLDKPVTPGTNVYAPPYIPIGERWRHEDDKLFTVEALREGTVELTESPVGDVAAEDTNENKTPPSWPPAPWPSASTSNAYFPEHSYMSSSVPEHFTERSFVPEHSIAGPPIPEHSNETSFTSGQPSTSHSPPEQSARRAFVPWRYKKRPYIPRLSHLKPSVPGQHTDARPPNCWNPNSNPVFPGPAASLPRPPRLQRPVLRATNDVNRGRGYSDHRPFQPDGRGFPPASHPPGALMYASMTSEPQWSPSPVFQSPFSLPGTSTPRPQIISTPQYWLVNENTTSSPEPWTDIPGNLSVIYPWQASPQLDGPTYHPWSSTMMPRDWIFHTDTTTGHFPADSPNSKTPLPQSEIAEESTNQPNSPPGAYTSDDSHFEEFYRSELTSPTPGQRSKFLDFFYNPSLGVPLEQSRSQEPTYSVSEADETQVLYHGTSSWSTSAEPTALNLPKKIHTVDAHARMTDAINRAIEKYPNNIYEVLFLIMKDLEWGDVGFSALKTTRNGSDDGNWCVTIHLEQEGAVKILIGPEGPQTSLREALELAASKFIRTHLMDINHFPVTVTIFSPHEVLREITDTPEETPDASSQDIPNTSSAQETPETSTAQETPETSPSQETPQTSSAQETPETSSAQQTPETSSAQQTPETSSHDSPDTSTQEIPYVPLFMPSEWSTQWPTPQA